MPFHDPVYLRGMQRRWHFLLAAPLSAEEKAALLEALQTQLKGWHSHGQAIPWSADVLYDQLLEISAHIPVSGCAIDTLFRTVQNVLIETGLHPLSTDWVLVLEKGKTFTKKFYEIVDMYRAGQWKPEWRILQPGEMGVVELPLEASYLAIHL